MAGRGAPPKPDDKRRRTNKPTRGWRYADGQGWRHGSTPRAPAGLTPAARSAWSTWFKAWFSWFWGPEDVPGLRQVIRLYDQVERGEFQRSGELRLAMDTYGITPKGQQDRRWVREAPPAVDGGEASVTSIAKYRTMLAEDAS